MKFVHPTTNAIGFFQFLVLGGARGWCLLVGGAIHHTWLVPCGGAVAFFGLVSLVLRVCIFAMRKGYFT